MKTFLIVFLLIFSTKSFGALYGYCLGDEESLSAAMSYLGNIKSPKDQFFKRESVNCLEVKGSSKTYGLYHRYLSKRFRILRTYKGQDAGLSDNSFLVQGMCRILVTKIGNNNRTTDTVELGKRGKIKRSESKGQSKSLSNLVLTYGKKGSIRVNSETVEITCQKAGSGYQLKFNLNSQTFLVPMNEDINKNKINNEQQKNVESVFIQSEPTEMI